MLDLGAGKGAAAIHLATTFGCHVTCFNLGANQNAHAAAAAQAAGVTHLVTCVRGNFNKPLPAEWTAGFDVVWSQEALCHASSQAAVLREVARVLRPGGVVVLTDIMRTVRASSSASSNGPDVTCSLCLQMNYTMIWFLARWSCACGAVGCLHLAQLDLLALQAPAPLHLHCSHQKANNRSNVCKCADGIERQPRVADRER